MSETQKKLINSAKAYDISYSKLSDILRSEKRFAEFTEIRLSTASFSFISDRYAFSFWITTPLGEHNEVVTVKGSEV